jgi:hypothetical protein
MIPTSLPSSPTNLRMARSAGVAITTSPTQFGRKTPSRMRLYEMSERWMKDGGVNAPMQLLGALPQAPKLQSTRDEEWIK